MVSPAIPTNEASRIEALREISILDSLPEKEYNDITKIASEICMTPISLVTLVDSDRQWFKSHRGIDVKETLREYSFCAHGINSPLTPLIVKNSKEDERFFDNPLVTGY